MLNFKEKVLRKIKPFIELPVGGMDISDLSIKYVKFGYRKNDLTFDFWGEFELSEGLIVNGEIKDEVGLTKLLSSWFAKENKKFRSTFFAVSLPEEKSFLKLLQLPKIKKEDVANAVRWEIEPNIPLSAEETVFDYEVISSPDAKEDHMDVVVTAFPRSIIDVYLKVLKNAGFKIKFLELESQAIARAVAGGFGDDSSRILVDLGRNRTSIILFDGASIIFTNTVALGGLVFEESISRALSVSRESAASIKKEYGLDPKAKEGKLFSALLPAITDLKKEIERVINYYENKGLHMHEARPKIKEIILTGGDANLDGLDTFLGSSLRVTVRKADPFASVKERLDMTVPPIARRRTLGFTTAVGLAMRGLQ